MRPLVAGNWKMNGLASDLEELARLKAALAGGPKGCEVLVCPPFTLLAQAASLVKDTFALGGQDCHVGRHGAYTGDISAEMLKDAGASCVILGHSERRHYHGETDADVAAKVQAAWDAGLRALICVGETQAERLAGRAHAVVSRQLEVGVPPKACPANTVVAYEPIWAIGSGSTPTGTDIIAIHSHIRSCLAAKLGPQAADIAILYGGSVKPDNAADILHLREVDGALVGGASLKSDDFYRIIEAC